MGLLDGVTAVRGQALTCQDCVELFYNLLVSKTSGGAVYGTGLGLSVANGEISYSTLVSADTKGPFVTESGGSLTLPFDTAGAAVILYNNGAVKNLRQLTSVKLDTLGGLSAKSSEKIYPISENVQVLLKDSSSNSYYACTLSDINSTGYTLTGWYDNLGYPAGGLIRIIVAAPKQ